MSKRACHLICGINGVVPSRKDALVEVMFKPSGENDLLLVSPLLLLLLLDWLNVASAKARTDIPLSTEPANNKLAKTNTIFLFHG